MQQKKIVVPIQKAVAIKYDTKTIAPQVIAKGQGVVAKNLIEKGESLGIATYKDEKLVKELLSIDLGDNIPPELYETVAQILIFISDLDKMASYRIDMKEKGL